MKGKDTRTPTMNIGFGMAFGGLLTLLIMMPFFGNDKEAFCVFPSVIIGFILIHIEDAKQDKKKEKNKKELDTIKTTMDAINRNRDEVNFIRKSDPLNNSQLIRINTLVKENLKLFDTLPQIHKDSLLKGTV